MFPNTILGQESCVGQAVWDQLKSCRAEALEDNCSLCVLPPRNEPWSGIIWLSAYALDICLPLPQQESRKEEPMIKHKQQEKDIFLPLEPM